MRRWIIASIAGAGIVLVAVLFVLSNKPVVTAGEDGIFENDCCGTIKLSGGKMLLNDQQTVRYTVTRDANGPYILPRTYVGVVLDEGFAVDGTTSAVKLRLDKLPQPNRIVLYEGLRPYAFTKHMPPRR
jgi:hypothetical protein